ncbi:MAG: DinB family protein [Chryseosolibacter sp.]
MTQTQHYIQTWVEARTRFTNLLKDLRAEDLAKKLVNTKNSAGFLIRHIADVELLFTKNVFGASDVKVQAKTVIAQRDTGEWTNLRELIAYQEEAFNQLKKVLELQTDQDWSRVITTKEFGSKTRAEAIGRIISHTAYHAGQLGLTLKYGQAPLATNG